MPFTPPDKAAETDAHQEQQVRLTVQRLLARHLRPGTAEFWQGMSMDLTGVTLVKFAFINCEVAMALFDGAIFAIPPNFTDTTFQDSDEPSPS